MKLRNVLIATLAVVVLAASGVFANVPNGLENLDKGNLFLVAIFIAALFDISMKILALSHILKHTECGSGYRVRWVLIVVFLNYLGPILYFCMGRSNKGESK
jgi:hypothetical protein